MVSNGVSRKCLHRGLDLVNNWKSDTVNLAWVIGMIRLERPAEFDRAWPRSSLGSVVASDWVSYYSEIDNHGNYRTDLEKLLESFVEEVYNEPCPSDR